MGSSLDAYLTSEFVWGLTKSAAGLGGAVFRQAAFHAAGAVAQASGAVAGQPEALVFADYLAQVGGERGFGGRGGVSRKRLR